MLSVLSATVAQAEFGIEYDGPVLVEGIMPVRDLAPALFALGELFTAASVKTHPEWKPVALNVKATEAGSFDVHLVLYAPDLWNQFVQTFSSNAATALDNFKDFVIGGGIGLFWLIKHLRGRHVTAQQPSGDGQVRLTLNDGTTLEAPGEVVALLLDTAIRARAREVVAPVGKSGVERVRFVSAGHTTVTVESADVSAFDEVEPEAVPLGENELDLTLEITSLTWVEGNRWRFSDGTNSFTATVGDRGFFERIHRGMEAFREGDKLRCRVRLVQTQRGDKITTDHHIVRVLEHIRREPQLTMEDPPNEGPE